MSYFQSRDDRFPLGLDRAPERLARSIKERRATQCLADKVCRKPRLANGLCADHNALRLRNAARRANS